MGAFWLEQPENKYPVPVKRNGIYLADRAGSIGTIY